MSPVLSVSIPAHNEARHIGKCIESVLASAQKAGAAVEVIVALNRCTDGTQAIAESLGARCVIEDSRCIAAVRNAAVRAGTAPAVATIDADSWMGPGTVKSVLDHVHDPRYIGGGARIHPERMSWGIFFTGLALAPLLLASGVSAGLFWFRRDTFEILGGFDESLVSVEDLDFARRLKAYGRSQGKRFGTLWAHGITTSCRKFDAYGDWHLLRNPKMVRGILSGRDRSSADPYYYDFDRNESR